MVGVFNSTVTLTFSPHLFLYTFIILLTILTDRIISIHKREANMYPKDLEFTIHNKVRKYFSDKPSELVSVEEFSEKDLLCRLIANVQSIRRMVTFFVWIVLIEITVGIVILTQLLK
jgi:hypothetical protein